MSVPTGGTMALRAAVLMCHAPIVIPSIGTRHGGDCLGTTRAMETAARAIVASRAETVLVVSPHTPRHPTSFGYVEGAQLRGDFRAFGAEDPVSVFRADPAAVATIVRQATRDGLPLVPTQVPSLDHGAMVPLWFLRQEGFQGRVAVFGFPWHREPDLSRRFGKSLAVAMDSLERPWALLASGDMSHALKPGAPAGYHPRASSFDETLVAYVRAGQYEEVSRIDPALRELAAEDVVDSLEVAQGVLARDRDGLRFLSYEAPFGVGYLVAILKETLS